MRFGSNQILFDSPYCRHNCGHFGKTIPLHPVPPLPPTLELKEADPEEPVATSSDQEQPVATGPDPEPREAHGGAEAASETCGDPWGRKGVPRRQKAAVSLRSPWCHESQG